MSVYLNKIKFIPIFILIIFYINCSNVIENRKFNNFSKEFLNQFFKYHPIEATQAGNRDYDNRLNTYGSKNINEMIQFYKLSAEKLIALDTTRLSEVNKINYQILSQQIKIRLFELEDWKAWQNDPGFYYQKLFDAIYSLHFHNPDTTEEKTRHLIARLDLMSDLIFNAKQNLQSLSPANFSSIIEQIQILKRTITFQLSDKFILSDTLVDSLSKKSEIVVDSIDSFIKFLESKDNNSSFKLSMTPEKYEAYVNLVLDEKSKPETLVAQIDSQYEKARENILNTAMKVVNVTINKNSAAAVRSLFDRVDSEIEKNAPNKEEIIPFCYETVKIINRFIGEIWHLSLPTEHDILIDWADYDRTFGTSLTHFEPPGLVESEPRYQCLIKPVLNNRDWIQQLTQVREFYNHPSLTVSMMIDAIPSHYHLWFNNLEDIPFCARVFPDQLFINSWNYYFAISLLDAGFEGYDPELRYILLKNYLRHLLVAKTEIQYYMQMLDYQQLNRELVSSNLFKRSEMNDVFYQVHYAPGQALTICRGVRLLQKLEDLNHKKLGTQFSMNEFFQTVLKQGPIPLKTMSKKMNKSN